MLTRDIVVVGSSAGGIEALLEFTQLLPKKFNGSIFIVQHLASFYRSNLDKLLGKRSALNVCFAKNGERYKKGHIYLAPPDHHLLVESERILVTKGPKENRFRPSIDALFRSAAYNFGERTIGIILSGLLDDGTSGLWSLKRLGGVTIVQDPEEALHDSMPKNAMQHVEVDYVAKIADMPHLLEQLTSQKITVNPNSNEGQNELLKKEVMIAAEDNALEMGILNMGTLSPFTCPECHGTLVSIKEGPFTRYRCHTGHAFSSSALLAEVTKTIEESLWNTLRGLEETIMLLENKGKEYEESGDEGSAAQFYKKAQQIREKSHSLRQMIFEHEQLSEEELEAARSFKEDT